MTAPFQARDSDRRRTGFYLAALAAVIVVSRLPQLLSPNLLLDGDEATAGLMARHLAQGGPFPIFFYGQHYGLSSVETAAGALAFRVFGSGAPQLKLAMLAIWTVGVSFLFLALSRYLGTARSFWIAMVFVLTPAWAVWSMKARGGYLTSFTAAAALLWLIVQDADRDTEGRWLVAGVLTAIVYLAHPLWLPGVLPIVAAVLVSRRRWLWAFTYLGAVAVVIFFVQLAPATGVDAWGGPPVGNADLLGSLPAVGRQIFVNLTGSYYLWWPLDPPGPVTRILAVVWCVVLPATAVAQLYRLYAARYCVWSHLLFASICSTLVAEWALLGARDGRYLLPLSAMLVALAGVEIFDLVDRRSIPAKAAAGVAVAMLLLGTQSMREFSRFSFLWENPPNSSSEARRLREAIDYLKARGVRHVFSMNGLLQWQLMFYGDEAVLARGTADIDRYPPYINEVNRALAAGEPVAVVGYTSGSGAPGCQVDSVCTGGIERLVAHPEAIFTVDGKYFLYTGASRELIEKLGFRLRD